MTDEITPMTPTMRRSSNGAMTAPTLLAAIEQVKKASALNADFTSLFHKCRLEIQSVRVQDLPDGEQKNRIIDNREHLVETLIKRKLFLARFTTDALDTLAKQLQRDRRQPSGDKERKQHPAQPASSGSITPDEEFLKLIELRDARLAKNARVEYIDGKRYEWAPGNVAGQRNSSLLATFTPTPNFYDVLDDAVCTPSVPLSAGQNVNRE